MDKMEYADYPALYQAADKASVKNQKIYTLLMGFNLSFMISAALLSILKLLFPQVVVTIYVIMAAMLLIGLIITFTLKIRKFDDVWYQGRALAESVKTLTWRYITCSEGFESKFTNEQSGKVFISKIEDLVTKFKEYTQHFDSKILLLPNVTNKMNEVRGKSFQERREYYAENRIEDQKNWYSDKAEYNRKKQNFWFIIILVAQFLAICSSVFLVVIPCTSWNFVGLFTTVASVGIAWNQLKQHQEHKQAYITAGIELHFIKEKALSITSEDEFSRYVLDSENAISREHTLWLVQKRK
jgi:hypothetical protein